MDRRLDLLVEPAWLESHLDDAELRIVDATWYLPQLGRDAGAEYAEGHIPGAIHLDVSTDLADETAPVRNTVAPPEKVGRLLSERGIGRDHRVVVYDRLGGYSAGRVWWVFHLLGHEAVALLNGGYVRWYAEGRPVTAEVADPTPARFEPVVRERWIRRRSDVLAMVRSGRGTVVDAREANRFRGEGPEPTKNRGHIPGSCNVAWDANLVGHPPFLRSPEELRALYEKAGVRFDRPVITTCGSGITASLTAFVLSYLGHDDVAVYDGSWAEWGDADDLPIETG